MGGARPKNVVEDGAGLWLAKFPDRGDKWSNARVEGAMLALAAECGIRAAAYRILTVAGKDVLLVKRFDRRRTDEGYLRHRMPRILGKLAQSLERNRRRRRWASLREYINMDIERQKTDTAGASNSPCGPCRQRVAPLVRCWAQCCCLPRSAVRMSRRSWQMTSHARAETVWTEVSSHGEVPSHSRIEIPFMLSSRPLILPLSSCWQTCYCVFCA